jgi:hypothetical protein
MYYLSYSFSLRPLDFLQVHNRALILRIRPQKFSSPRNVAPRGRWPARLAGIRRARPRLRPEVGGTGCPNPQGLDSGGWLALGGGRRAAHRRPTAVAATGRAAAWLRLGRGWQGARQGEGRRHTCATRRPASIYAGIAHRATLDGPVVTRVRPTTARNGDFEAHRCRCGLGRREPRDGGQTAGRGPAPARAYGGGRRRIARRGVRGRALERETAADVMVC